MLALFHPGDLSIDEWIRILGFFLGVPSLIALIVGLLLYGVVKRHSRSTAATNSLEDS